MKQGPSTFMDMWEKVHKGRRRERKKQKDKSEEITVYMPIFSEQKKKAAQDGQIVRGKGNISFQEEMV
ncbi:hypothetical protein Y1Q_0019275 [Alligator mississippiensis]|uniref:Uncharacterized protein n=1 Tax=Alligator mississippiensis TaxID=8496 RepID=A0A151MR06_ALLMI|nr:hypothetical protein Y1Q_0019275 [Alligator mississippiensis]